jgi:ferredoxin-NADP reductase
MSEQLLVRSMAVESEGVLSVELVDPQRRDLPAWEPGAHLDLHLRDGLSRQYSLSGDPRDRKRYRLGVLREPAGRGGSEYVHDTLRPGQMVGFAGPRNHFRLEPAASYVFIAGGIGITPILPMVREAAATGADWRLLYTARTAGRMAFRDEVLALSGDRVHLRSDDVDGLLDVGDVISHAPGGTQVYACGPAGLLASLEEACDRHGVRLYVERFTAPVTEAAEDRAFTLVAARSGLTVPVPAYDTALAAVRRAGVAVDTACENGVCGSCQVRVLDGCPDQRDTITTRRGAETDHVMMLCVSRARTASITVDI